MSLTQDAYILIWTEQVSCLRVNPHLPPRWQRKAPGLEDAQAVQPPRKGLGVEETEGFNRKPRRLPGSRWGPSRGLRGGLRAGRRGFVPEAEGLAYRAAHPEAGGGRAGHAAEPQPGRGRGAGAEGGRRGGRGGEGGGCRGLLPHSPGQRGPASRCRLGLAAGRRTPCAPLMSPSVAGEVCAQPGRLRAAPRGSSCPAQGLGGCTSGRKREKESVRARRAAAGGGRGRRAPGRTAPPHPPRRVGRRAPETLAHGRAAAAVAGGARLRARPPRPPCPSPGPRAQLTSGDCDRGSGAPTRPRAERCARAGVGGEKGAGGVGVPAREGHLEGGDRRGLGHPGRGRRESRGLQPLWAKVRAPRPPPRGAAAEGARGLPRPRVCGASPVT